MTALATAGAGFLLAVLWFDLMFDVQVRARAGGEAGASAVDSIAAYYRRVTTDAAPMNRLVALVMLVTAGALVAQLAGDEVRAWVAWVSLGLAAPAFAIAGLRTFPAAVRLGSGGGAADERAALARSILRDHLVCLGLITALLAVQLAEAL